MSSPQKLLEELRLAIGPGQYYSVEVLSPLLLCLPLPSSSFPFYYSTRLGIKPYLGAKDSVVCKPETNMPSIDASQRLQDTGVDRV